MEMTIDNAIRYYEDKNVVLTEEEALANTIAINTMRKYKQITEIVMNGDDTHYKLLMQIKEVVEDGNE